MKLTINKKLFLQSWNLAERSTSGIGTVSILSSVKISASCDGVTLHATDVRTSIICSAVGVTVIEPGEEVFPVKMVSELFKKAPGEEFAITVEDGKAILIAEHSRYMFSTYSVNEFPKLPSSANASVFCKLPIGSLEEAVEEGTLAASTGEEFPLYLSSVNFQVENSKLCIVSTDTRRLALSSAMTAESAEKANSLLPMKGVKELQRIMSVQDPNSIIEILFDASQFYFKTSNFEFSIRRVESHFPPYEKILPKAEATTIVIDRGELISALERVDVIVRDYNRMVVLDIAPGANLVMKGRAPDFGQAREEINAEISGEALKIAVNSKFFKEPLKVIRCQKVKLSFSGASGHIVVKKLDDDSFLCLIAPINLAKEELETDD